MIETLLSLGWDEARQLQLEELGLKGLQPARILSRNNRCYTLAAQEGDFPAALAGRMLHQGGDLPVVGDWVAVEQKGTDLLIQALLPRHTCFARKPAISGGRRMSGGRVTGGATEQQALAANIDTVFLVSGLDGNFSPARLERYLAVSTASKAQPVVLLNKADLCPDLTRALAETAQVAGSHPVHTLSAHSGQGLECLLPYLQPGKTVAFLGSSGVGKSTLINRLFGEDLLITAQVSQHSGKGRHTTTTAALLRHRGGYMLIDTPGLRELQLWCGEQAVEDTFEDVIELIGQCRFSDCSHQNEPGCAVRQAIASGQLSPQRLQRYQKLNGEVQRLEGRKKQWELVQARKRKYQR